MLMVQLLRLYIVRHFLLFIAVNQKVTRGAECTDTLPLLDIGNAFIIKRGNRNGKNRI